MRDQRAIRIIGDAAAAVTLDVANADRSRSMILLLEQESFCRHHLSPVFLRGLDEDVLADAAPICVEMDRPRAASAITRWDSDADLFLLQTVYRIKDDAAAAEAALASWGL